MQIDVKVKALFFDRKHVEGLVDKARRAYLAKAGFAVRQTARGSIKSSSKPSSPGQPPHSRMHAKLAAMNRRLRRAGKARVTGGFQGIKHILFAYSPAEDTVIVGPISNGRSNAPSILEFGGATYIWDKGKKQFINVSPRPFMGPALEKEAPKFPQIFSDQMGKR